MLTVSFEIKDLFFDKPAVISKVSAAKRKELSQFGAFVRQSARTSIRHRKGTSPPGKPPYSHEGSLRRKILFGYDPQSESVVVGPLGFRKSDAPHLLEYGGKATIQRRGKRVRATYKPRPYMGPAFDETIDQLPAMWRGSV